jgi:uncharacterized MAPEG superfamily protein
MLFTPPSAYTTLSLCFALAYAPHLMKAIVVNQKLTKESVNNSSKDADKKSIIRLYDLRWPRLAVYAAIDNTQDGRLIARLDAAHYNALENYPLLVAAVLGALFAGVDASQVQLHAFGYFCLRVVYTVLYAINVQTRTALARSLVWILSLIVLFHLLFLAASMQK